MTLRDYILLAALFGFTMAGSASPREVSGVASWYDDGAGLYGAAGPALREALGGDPAFRGKHVTVCAQRCVTVVLRDFCQCRDRHGVPTVIDLSPSAFRRLAPLSAGVVRVRVSLAIALPETDSEGTP